MLFYIGLSVHLDLTVCCGRSSHRNAERLIFICWFTVLSFGYRLISASGWLVRGMRLLELPTRFISRGILAS